MFLNFEMGHPRPLFVYLCLFKQTLHFLQQIYEKKCPSSIWCLDSNPQPSGHESPPITRAPAQQRKCCSENKKNFNSHSMGRTKKTILGPVCLHGSSIAGSLNELNLSDLVENDRRRQASRRSDEDCRQCYQIGRFLQSIPNILVTFWAISNNVIIL